MSFSRLLNVHQKFPDRRIADIPGAIAKELAAAGMAKDLKPGARIAIGVGSRGIANVATIVRAVVDYWKSRGFSPFLFPAMGSDGRGAGRCAGALRHYRGDDGMPGDQFARSGAAWFDARRDRSVHG
jgi:hypothetical protein